jgi:hypothetical protein
MTKSTTMDRRKFPRITVSDTTYASFRPGYRIVGQVKDVSRTGLSFEYVLLDKSTTDSDAIPQTLDIIQMNRSFHLSGLPYEIVYDRPLDDRSSLIGLESRLCGLKFVNLTPQQQKKIDTLIQVAFLKEEKNNLTTTLASA